MPNPTAITLKFVHPAARYHQDIRTVTIHKHDAETDESSELYRVCDPPSFPEDPDRQTLSCSSSNTPLAEWPLG